ncbi:MAG TPA: proton-conducting transporter membrane subunit, partial [Gemmataceae bacterium]
MLRSLLLAVLLLPAAAALAVLFAGARSYRAARGIGLVFVLLHLALTAALVVPAADFLSDPGRHSRPSGVFVPEFVPGAPRDEAGNVRPEFAHETAWAVVSFDPRFDPSSPAPPESAIRFFVGLDGFNVWLVALASFLMLPAVLSTWDSVRDRANHFYAWLFLLQAAILGVFLAFDIILFYVFFELTLIPGFFLIGMWGVSSGRREAARKFFLYTLAGGLISLVGVVAVVLVTYSRTGALTFSIPELVEVLRQQYAAPGAGTFWPDAQYWLFLALALGFVIKIPLVPLHSWQPNAYAEAPMSVTIILSAVLAKLGTFGLLRVVMPLTPDATLSVGLPLLGTLAAVGILYGA